MRRRAEDDGDTREGARDPRMGGLVGAAERAPLTQGRDASVPLELEGDDLTAPPETPRMVRGAPTEPALHAPTTTEVDPLPVATGEPTVETLEGEAVRGDEG